MTPFEDFSIEDDEMTFGFVLVCPHCSHSVCDVESGDSLGTLTRVAEDHAASCAYTPMTPVGSTA